MPRLETPSRRISNGWRLVLVLAVVLSMTGVGVYFASLHNQAKRRCIEQCAASGKQGDLVPVIERMRSGSGTAAFTPTECVCR
jgi:hypothetical protein